MTTARRMEGLKEVLLRVAVLGRRGGPGLEEAHGRLLRQLVVIRDDGAQVAGELPSVADELVRHWWYDETEILLALVGRLDETPRTGVWQITVTSEELIALRLGRKPSKVFQAAIQAPTPQRRQPWWELVPPPFVEPFRRRTFHFESYEEIGSKLGLSPNVVRSRTCAAWHKLNGLLV